MLVFVVTEEAEAEPEVEPTLAEDEVGVAAPATEADVDVDDVAGEGAEETTGGLVAAGAEAEDDADVA